MAPSNSMVVEEAPVKGRIAQSPAAGGISTKTKLCYAVLALLVVAVIVAVPVTITQFALHRRTTRGGTSSGGNSILTSSYCDNLQGAPRAYCVSYLHAKGADKFMAASLWLQASQETHVCAGIDVACLNEDIASAAEGTSCRALEEGASCAAGKQCSQGVCQNAAAPPTLATLNTTNSTNSTNSTDLTPEQLRSPFVPAAPNATWPTAYAAIWPSNVGRKIPQGFLATSHEWKRMEDYGGENVQAFANIFHMLAATPVLRIGGSSQDLMQELPGPEVWAALKRLHKATNCRYIIGLPLHQRNATAMSRQMMITAKKELGPAVLGYELGNEPEFWLKTGLGGWTEEGNWVPGFAGYAPYFDRVATALNPCDDPEGPQLSGPGWGNVNTQDPNWFSEVTAKGKCYLKEVNTHYYPYINNETVTAQELLSQWLQDFALEKFRVYAKIAQEYKLDIRISETNSLYGGGRVGLSDTMTGAFWVADALFAFANAGARAFHLHWGKGGEPSGNSQPNTGVQTNFEKPEGRPPLPWPSVHAPWYGYLFWTLMSAGGYGRDADSSFVAANVDRWDNCTANIKLWALKSDTEELRIAILNKDTVKSCNMELKLEHSHCQGQANMTRMLPGLGGIFSKAGITIRGQHYMEAGISGKIRGQVESEEVTPLQLEDGSCKLVVAAPAITATILVIPGASKGAVGAAASSEPAGSTASNAAAGAAPGGL